jgi:hypothetical protein
LLDTVDATGLKWMSVDERVKGQECAKGQADSEPVMDVPTSATVASDAEAPLVGSFLVVTLRPVGWFLYHAAPDASAAKKCVACGLNGSKT